MRYHVSHCIESDLPYNEVLAIVDELGSPPRSPEQLSILDVPHPVPRNRFGHFAPTAEYNSAMPSLNVVEIVNVLADGTQISEGADTLPNRRRYATGTMDGIVTESSTDEASFEEVVDWEREIQTLRFQMEDMDQAHFEEQQASRETIERLTRELNSFGAPELNF